uniref:Uncharacterized protein n=1 Tax=Peronospora matthiolae TaxID=2874970 RepID=A0AAV1VFQ5_9STRA
MDALLPPASPSSMELTSTPGSSRCKMVLEEPDLWEVVSGEIKAEQCGSSAMEDSQLPVGPVGKWCMRRMVKVEEDHFEKKSLANKLFLRRRFFTTMTEEGDDVLEGTSTSSRRWRNS